MRFAFDNAPIAPTPLTSLPPLPSGERLKISAPGLGVGLGGRLWPSASLLCRWLRNEDLRKLHVLELGAGCGPVGLFAAALGAESVLLTDGGGDGLLETLAGNVGRNHCFVGNRAAVCAHKWGERDMVLPPRVDLVLGADVTYSRQSHEALLRSVRWLCDERAPRVVLAHEHRLLSPAAEARSPRASRLTVRGVATEDVALQHLCELADGLGLHVTTIRQETAEREADQAQEMMPEPRHSAISLLEVTVL